MLPKTEAARFLFIFQPAGQTPLFGLYRQETKQGMAAVWSCKRPHCTTKQYKEKDMRDKTIRVLTKMPGSMWRVQHIDNTLEALQKYVGGYIETVRLFKDVVVICNEEGRLMGLPENVNLLGVQLCGPVIVAGVWRDEFANLKEQYIKNWANVIEGEVEE